MVEVIYALAALASAAAAVLAWLAKIRWANEYKEAKEAQISHLESEIKSLERLSPPVLKEWLEASQVMAKAQVETKDREIGTLKEQIEALRNEDLSRTQVIAELEHLAADLELEKKGLQTKFPLDQFQYEPGVRNWIIRNTEDIVTGRLTPEELATVTGMPIPQARGFLIALQSNVRYLNVMKSL